MLSRWIRSLSARLWITSVGALAIGLVVLAAFVIYAFNHFSEEISGRDDAHAVAIANGLEFDQAGMPVSVHLPEQVTWVFGALPTELRYRVLDAHGTVLLSSKDGRDGAAWFRSEPANAVGKTGHVSIDGEVFYVVTRRVAHGSTVFYVQTATSARLVELSSSAEVKPVPAVVETMIVLAMFVFALTLPLTVHRVLRPLRDASRDAVSITPRSLKTRLPLKGVPSEIAPLICAFNEALERLENGFAVQQRFLAAAAHELRTPLTLLRGEIELQPDIRNKDALFRQIDLMTQHVRQLLHLAEVSEPQNFSFAKVHYVDVARDVMSYLKRKADEKQVTLEMEISGSPSTIWADQGALFIFLKNIVENAINVSPASGIVSLIIDEASIKIRDEGPGIPEKDLPLMFERFWRARNAQHEGAGLGLAICKEIAVAHEWRLLVNSDETGTEFVVWF